MIYTSYFAKHKNKADDKIAYVSIAVGNPKYPVAYNIIDLKMLKPYGIFGKYHGDEYKRKYFERLDSFGVDKILLALDNIGKGFDDILLMCHEKDPIQCHRSMFAEWWFRNTGEIIEEYGKQNLTQVSLF